MTEHEHINLDRLVPIVTRDGTRPWHTRFAAVEQPEIEGLGACIWSADLNIKDSTLTHLRESEQISTKQEVFMMSGVGLVEFYGSSISVSKTPVHPHNYCDQRWVGLARFPLPMDFAKPLSRWEGWTHFYHSDEKLGDITDRTFEFLYEKIRQHGYPNDLRGLTIELIQRVNPKILKEALKHWERFCDSFPWLDPRLVQPQFSQSEAS